MKENQLKIIEKSIEHHCIENQLKTVKKIPWKSLKFHWTSKKIIETQSEIIENHWQSIENQLKINRNLWKSIENFGRVGVSHFSGSWFSVQFPTLCKLCLSYLRGFFGNLGSFSDDFSIFWFCPKTSPEKKHSLPPFLFAAILVAFSGGLTVPVHSTGSFSMLLLTHILTPSSLFLAPFSSLWPNFWSTDNCDGGGLRHTGPVGLSALSAFSGGYPHLYRTSKFYLRTLAILRFRGVAYDSHWSPGQWGEGWKGNPGARRG